MGCHVVSLYLLVRQDQSTRSVPYASVRRSNTEKDRDTGREHNRYSRYTHIWISLERMEM